MFNDEIEKLFKNTASFVLMSAFSSDNIKRNTDKVKAVKDGKIVDAVQELEKRFNIERACIALKKCDWDSQNYSKIPDIPEFSLTSQKDPTPVDNESSEQPPKTSSKPQNNSIKWIDDLYKNTTFDFENQYGPRPNFNKILEECLELLGNFCQSNYPDIRRYANKVVTWAQKQDGWRHDNVRVFAKKIYVLVSANNTRRWQDGSK